MPNPQPAPNRGSPLSEKAITPPDNNPVIWQTRNQRNRRRRSRSSAPCRIKVRSSVLVPSWYVESASLRLLLGTV